MKTNFNTIYIVIMSVKDEYWCGLTTVYFTLHLTCLFVLCEFNLLTKKHLLGCWTLVNWNFLLRRTSSAAIKLWVRFPSQRLERRKLRPRFDRRRRSSPQLRVKCSECKRFHCLSRELNHVGYQVNKISYLETFGKKFLSRQSQRALTITRLFH